MKSRKEEKIDEIEKYLFELEEILPTDLEEYKRDIKQKAYCERYFEKIVEAVIDLVFLIIRERGLKTPEDDESSFNILKKENLISETICRKLIEAKGMRNIIAHEYGKIDDEKVFHSITEEIIPDTRDFLNTVKNI